MYIIALMVVCMVMLPPGATQQELLITLRVWPLKKKYVSLPPFKHLKTPIKLSSNFHSSGKSHRVSLNHVLN